nr:1729_t:CDS:2 [Entrophospora candida]
MHIKVKEELLLKEDIFKDVQKEFEQDIQEKDSDPCDNDNESFRLDRGKDLANDLKHLLKESRFNDFSIICGKDRKKVKGCKAILASRCNIFNSIILSDTGNKNEVIFSDIEPEAMEMVLEFLYTGDVEDCQAKEFDILKIIETYYAAFQLKIHSLEKVINEYVKKRLKSPIAIDKNLAPKLLSGLIEKFMYNNKKMVTNGRNEVEDLADFLIEYISKIPFDLIDLDSISFDALEFLLANTLGTNKFKNQFDKFEPFLNIQKLEKSDMVILIQPLNLFSENRIRKYYQELAFEKNDMTETRGFPYIRWKSDLTEFIECSEGIDDVDGYGGEFAIKSVSDFKTAKCISTNLSMSGDCAESCIGANEDKMGNSWSLCTDARIYKDRVKSYHFAESDETSSISKKFFWSILYGITEGVKIVMTVDMTKRTLKFEFDGYKCSLDGRWGTELPTKLYPFLAFESPGSKVIVKQYANWREEPTGTFILF